MVRLFCIMRSGALTNRRWQNLFVNGQMSNMIKHERYVRETGCPISPMTMSMLHFPRWRSYVSKAEVRGECCYWLILDGFYYLGMAFRRHFVPYLVIELPCSNTQGGSHGKPLWQRALAPAISKLFSQENG